MGTREYSDNCILAELGAEPAMAEELKAVAELVRGRSGSHVVVDFSSVDIVTSSSLAALLRLQKVVNDAGGELVLCSVADLTIGIFAVTGLENVFTFARDRLAAMVSIRARSAANHVSEGNPTCT